MIEIGKILKPHGIQGQLKVRLYSDNFESFERRGYAFIQQKEETRRIGYAVMRSEPPFVYVLLGGVSSRNDAEEFCGLPLMLRRSDLEEPEEGEHYIVDMIGLKVVNESGTELGELKDILQHGAADVYVVQGQKGFMFPAVKRVITEVDLDAGVLRVDSASLEEVAVYDNL
jgi:16S rRNA processing protein RimM